MNKNKNENKNKTQDNLSDMETVFSFSIGEPINTDTLHVCPFFNCLVHAVQQTKTWYEYKSLVRKNMPRFGRFLFYAAECGHGTILRRLSEMKDLTTDDFVGWLAGSISGNRKQSVEHLFEYLCDKMSPVQYESLIIYIIKCKNPDIRSLILNKMPLTLHSTKINFYCKRAIEEQNIDVVRFLLRAANQHEATTRINIYNKAIATCIDNHSQIIFDIFDKSDFESKLSFIFVWLSNKHTLVPMGYLWLCISRSFAHGVRRMQQMFPHLNSSDYPEAGYQFNFAWLVDQQIIQTHDIDRVYNTFQTNESKRVVLFTLHRRYLTQLSVLRAYRHVLNFHFIKTFIIPFVSFGCDKEQNGQLGAYKITS